jgi:hypothetical protein
MQSYRQPQANQRPGRINILSIVMYVTRYIRYVRLFPGVEE